MVARGSGRHRPGCSGRRCAPTRWRSIGVTMVGTGWDDAVLVGDAWPPKTWHKPWACRVPSMALDMSGGQPTTNPRSITSKQQALNRSRNKQATRSIGPLHGRMTISKGNPAKTGDHMPQQTHQSPSTRAMSLWTLASKTRWRSESELTRTTNSPEPQARDNLKSAYWYFN